jgi:hypothetical protein
MTGAEHPTGMMPSTALFTLQLGTCSADSSLVSVMR